MVKENQDGYFVYEHEDRKDLVAGVLDGHGVNGRQVIILSLETTHSPAQKAWLTYKVSSFVKESLGKKLIKKAAQADVPTQQRFESAFNETASELNVAGFDVRQSGLFEIVYFLHFSSSIFAFELFCS